MVNTRKIDSRTVTMFVYGLCVTTSGLYRYVSEEGGSAGLWFGIVMGSIALAAGFAYWFGKRIIGHVLAWLSIAFVGGWFFYEALIKKGWAEAETRLLLMFALSVAVGLILLAVQFQPRKVLAP